MSTTNVTGTITDSDGTAWAGGTWLAQFVPAAPGSNISGSTFTTLFSGTLDATGTFTQALTDVNTIAPAGGLWRFTFVSNTSAAGASLELAITGASQNISAAASAAVTAPRIGAFVLPHAYNDTEMLTPPAPGGLYFSVSTGVVRMWTGTVWLPINTSGTVNVVFTTTPVFNGQFGALFKMTLTANVASSTFTNGSPGQIYTFELIQDGVGGHTFVWPTNFKNPPVIDGTANAINIQTFIFDGVNAYPISPLTVN